MIRKMVNGDCLEVMQRMKESSVDSIVTDPPYGLSFMGKNWDHGVPGVAFWQQALRVLKPGGHLLAFGGSRTYHRLACAIEDAGFEIRDQIMWLYGSGFPKSLDVSKAIDKAAGAEREVVGKTLHPDGNHRNLVGRLHGVHEGGQRLNGVGLNITSPATDSARQWSGWGTALKPAHEPIVVARKPLSEKTVAENVLTHGTGALNIDGCRVGTNDALGGGMVSMGRPKVSEGWDRPWMHNNEITGQKKIESAAKVAIAESLGRWPANVIHDGSEEVVGLFPDSKSSGGKGSASGLLDGEIYGSYSGNNKGQNAGGLGDSGSAARFFYCAKASKTDRSEGNNHPTVKPTSLMRYLCRLVTPPGGVVLDPFAGSGSTGVAAGLEGFHFVGIEKDEKYCEIAENRLQTGVV